MLEAGIKVPRLASCVTILGCPLNPVRSVPEVIELDSTSNVPRARAQRSGARARNRKGGAVMADQISDHEKRDVYRLAIDYVAETYRIDGRLGGNHHDYRYRGILLERIRHC